MTTYPNTFCTCGYSRFRETRRSEVVAVSRWMRFDSEGGGFGSTPFGSFFGGNGGGEGASWGLFPGLKTTTTLSVACEKCSRVRRSKVVGSFAPYGAYVLSGTIYIVGSDFVRPTGCYRVELVGEDGVVYDLPLTWSPTLPAPLQAEAPAITADIPPTGAALVSDVLTAPLPEVDVSQTYTVVLINTCAGSRTSLVSVVLESTPMILLPLDAFLGGAPRAWLFGQRGRHPAAAVGSGGRVSLPFDKPQAVVEYNAREGTLPSAQGFTHVGTGVPADYQLLPGGLLGSTAAGLDSYWTKTVALASNPTEAYLYARIQSEAEVSHAAGDGWLASAAYAQAVSTPYVGPALGRSGGSWWGTALDGTTDALVRATARGWSSCCGYANDASQDQAWVDGEVGVPLSGAFVPTGTAGALEAIVEWGDKAGSGVDAVVDHVVASFGGRFIRPRFTAVAPSTSPVIRFYGMSDPNGSSGKLVRFKLRAALGTADPHAEGGIVVYATVNVTASSAIYALSFTIPGLTAREPFTFTLERDVGDAGDTLEATFHVLHGTVQSS